MGDFELRVTVINDGEGGCGDAVSLPENTRSGAIPASSFTLLPLLPTEIRLKIWSHAIFPRVVLAAVVQSTPSRPSRDPVEPEHAWETQRGQRLAKSGRKMRQVPALLHVCRESRQVGLDAYAARFSWKGAPVERRHGGGGEEEERGRGANGVGKAGAKALPPPVAVTEALDALPVSSLESLKTRPGRAFFSRPNARHVPDTLFLAGDLEPFSQETGIAFPAAYYFYASEAAGVRSLAIPFSSLKLDQLEAEDVVTVLFHVFDRFSGLEDGVLTVVLEDGDEKVLDIERMGRVRTAGDDEDGGGWKGQGENVVMKIWRACMRGHFKGKDKGGGVNSVEGLSIEMVEVGCLTGE